MIPYCPAEELERALESGSRASIHYRGYTAESMVRAFKKYGPVFQADINGEREVLLAGMEANELAWRNPDDWSYHEASAVFREELSHLHLTQLDGEAHRRKRRLLNKAFKKGSILAHLPKMAEEVFGNLLQHDGERIELHEVLMMLFTRLNSISSVRVSLSDDQIREMIDFEEGFIGALFLKPEERRTVYNRVHYLETKRAVLAYLEQLVRKRYEHTGDGDLLDEVMHQKVSSSLEPLSLEELIYDAYLILIAGTGNTAKTLCRVIDALLDHPTWMERLKAEVAGFNASSLSRGMDPFPLLKATLMEAERLFAAAPTIPRVPARDLEFLGYHLPAGTHCLHLITLMHFHEEVYQDPYEFKPERWLDHEYPKSAHGTFGGGTHVCLGMNVARIHMPLFLAALLSGYRIERHGPPRTEPFAYPGEVDAPTLRYDVTFRSLR